MKIGSHCRLIHRVPNEHGGSHILDHVHSPSIHFSSLSHGGSHISGFNFTCCRKQTPVFVSHNSHSFVHGLSKIKFPFF